MEAEVRREPLMQRLKALGGRLGKYRYAWIVVLAGVLMMLMPRGCAQQSVQASAEPVRTSGEEEMLADMERRLASLIAKMDGAGRCEVMLSLETGSERTYQTDVRSTTSDSGGSRESSVVFAQTGSEKQPVVQKTSWPVYRGAVVVCQGADRASVRLMIVEAVSSLTGLGSDKIRVVKLKGQ